MTIASPLAAILPMILLLLLGLPGRPRPQSRGMLLAYLGALGVIAAGAASYLFLVVQPTFMAVIGNGVQGEGSHAVMLDLVAGQLRDVRIFFGGLGVVLAVAMLDAVRFYHRQVGAATAV